MVIIAIPNQQFFIRVDLPNGQEVDFLTFLVCYQVLVFTASRLDIPHPVSDSHIFRVPDERYTSSGFVEDLPEVFAVHIWSNFMWGDDLTHNGSKSGAPWKQDIGPDSVNALFSFEFGAGFSHNQIESGQGFDGPEIIEKRCHNNE